MGEKEQGGTSTHSFSLGGAEEIARDACGVRGRAVRSGVMFPDRRPSCTRSAGDCRWASLTATSTVTRSAPFSAQASLLRLAPPSPPRPHHPCLSPSSSCRHAVRIRSCLSAPSRSRPGAYLHSQLPLRPALTPSIVVDHVHGRKCWLF